MSYQLATQSAHSARHDKLLVQTEELIAKRSCRRYIIYKPIGDPVDQASG
ncbi:hypothetical protein HanIR_Chr12g0586581 [Helianthus annuus]|nr:hypothetical protein HanIR_Chr12g0586581 [Helianthus annuus]